MFQIGYLYELPFGPGKKWATGGVAATVLGGWQINGTFSAYQGRPYTLTASDATLNMPGNQQTPVQIKSKVEKLGKAGEDGTWFDIDAFARPTGAQFGNVGRNTMRGPGVVNTDVSLFRTFKIREKLELQFRAEAFNFSNTPHFGNPDDDGRDINSDKFGKILETQSADAIARSREFRFALRVSF
jgi:hypothetical protein